MNPLPVHNVRSPQQWEAVSKHVDFRRKSVIDLGCGYGDILARCHIAGATFCMGVEGDCGVVVNTQERMREGDIDCPVFCCAIEDIDLVAGAMYDVAICFSVLPYQEDFNHTLQWMKDHSLISLIEAQYQGDGIGDNWYVKNDLQMKWLLTYYWDSIQIIGETYVESRDVYRTIWACQ